MAIISFSETISDYQKEEVEKAFNTKVYCLYGHSEKCCVAWECKESRLYHIIDQYGYTEIVNSDNDDVSMEDELGEIVCTGFNNQAFPFIRYRTGDIVVNTNETCSCGRNYRSIKRVEGRVQDFFVDRTGFLIPNPCTDKVLYKIKDKINLYQFVQNEPGKVLLRLECKEPVNEEELEAIRQKFKEKYKRLHLDTEIAEHIERTINGKMRYMVQNVQTDYLKNKLFKEAE
jgi:phenylacetate-CoA ligase